MARLISCVRCGRIHEENKCNKAEPIYGRKNQTKSYRNNSRWIHARKQALERDKYLCKMCLLDGIIETHGIEVHHIIPIYKDSSKCYDVDNLICLCRNHHRLIEDNSKYDKILHELQNMDVKGFNLKS